MRKLLSVIGLVLACCAAWSATAFGDGPGSGAATVVALGDSAISGEGGRWAGNTNGSSNNVDALGSTAYNDNASNTAELIKGCHRSKAAEIHIGGGVVSQNLACSGAKTSTTPFSSGSDFKPGIDFYNDGAGHMARRWRCSSTRRAQREAGPGPDRRQQLPLRRSGPELRDRLADLAVVVAELLQRRLQRDEQLHRVQHRRRRRRRSRTRS